MISRRDIGNAVEARLKAAPGPGPTITVYRGELPTDPPQYEDESGRVAPYVIMYTSAGRSGFEEDVATCVEDLRMTIQLTVVAGYLEDLEYTLDRLLPWMRHWSPDLRGLGVGRLDAPLGYDPGPARVNNDVRPPRFWTPFQYNLDVTT